MGVSGLAPGKEHELCQFCRNHESCYRAYTMGVSGLAPGKEHELCQFCRNHES